MMKVELSAYLKNLNIIVPNLSRLYVHMFVCWLNDVGSCVGWLLLFFQSP